MAREFARRAPSSYDLAMRGALVLLLLGAFAYADTAPHKEGQYGGVIPGEPQPRDASGKPDRPRRPPPKGTLTWIGFEAKGGGAQVFFQSAARFELTQRVEGKSLVVHLGVPRLGHNTWRQIDTRFFDNPLASIAARAVGGARATKARPARAAGIDVRIAFKDARDIQEAAVRTATEADGMYYAYLTFPAGTGAPAPGTSTIPDAEGPEGPEGPEPGGAPAPRETPSQPTP
jgi:hypothetical protein